MIRVVLAEDHHLVREGIRALLEKATDISIVGEASDGQEALELVRELTPDVLVTDIAMPCLNGIQVTEHLNSLGMSTEVVILSMYSDPTLVRQALRAGARGFLVKRSLTAELLSAVRAGARKETYLSNEVSGPVVDTYIRSLPDDELTAFDKLTPRERQVLQLIAQGLTNRAISGELQISVKTVEKHRARIVAKLGVQDVAGLVRIAIKHGLVFVEM